MSRKLDLAVSTPRLQPHHPDQQIETDSNLLQYSPNLSSVKSAYAIRPIFKNTTLHSSQESSPLRSPDDSSMYQSRVFKIKRPHNKHRVYQSVDMGKKKEEDPVKVEYEQLRKKLNTPLKQDRVQSIDEQPQGVMGRDAIDKFYNHYKHLDKIKDINHYAVVSDSMYTNFLSKGESLKLFPAKLGILREKGSETALKASHFRIGDKYAEVVSEGIRGTPTYKNFEFSHNRLTPKGADNLLPRLVLCAETLDLSENNIGKLGCEHISRMLHHKKSKLLEMNLEGNKLGDYAMKIILEGVENNPRIKKLNLGKNLLSDQCCEELCKMLENNASLEELILRWNQIKGPGGLQILQGLKQATQLRVLDISWNSLGCHSSKFAPEFAEFIKTNQNLVHLDMSNNYIGSEDTKVISEALNENHTLYGFHFQGNHGYVDNKGFLQVIDADSTSVAFQHLHIQIDGVNTVKESVKKYIDGSSEFKDCCWVCEGWHPYTFSWNEESGSGQDDPIFLHMSYDGFKNRFIPKNQDFKTDRMIPPLQFEYFFNVQDTTMAAEDQPKKSPLEPTITMLMNGKEEKIFLEQVNYMKARPQQQVLDPITYEPLFPPRPRIPDEVYVPPEEVEERPEWVFKMGYFRDFKVETQQTTDKCFEADWNNCKILRVVKKEDEIEPVRNLLKAIYPRLKDCYKFNSAENVVSDVWSVQRNQFTAFCQGINIFQSAPKVALSDFDRLFITILAKTDKTKNHRSPDNAMVRHNWLESFVRLADMKYLSTGTCPNIVKSVEAIINEHLKPVLPKYNINQWREEKYFKEDVDTVVKSYMPIWQGLFKQYSGEKTMPSLPPFSSLDEFRKLVNDAEFINESCAERDVNVSFNYAIMTQVDELTTNRVFEMYLLEFIEAVCRIIDLSSPAPFGVETATMPFKERQAQSLAIKIEGAMRIFYQRCCPKETRDLYIMPDQSIFEMEEHSGKVKGQPKKKKMCRLNPTHPSSHTAYS